MDILLALETTEKYGSIALLDGKHLLSEIRLPQEKRSAQTLAPAMDTILREAKIVPQKISVVAVVVGPGSFTGLRVGVVTAKIFAYAVGAKVVGVNTFDAVAEKCSRFESDYLSVGVDAQRGEVSVALFKKAATGYEVVGKSELIRVADWWKQAEQLKNVVFSGPALERWHTKIPPNVVLADPSFWFPQASAAGKIAAERLTQPILTETVWSLQPVYSRLSAAEEKIIKQ
ncbi:MAG: tRNA (adenosine(37)-N6)-threonylcarbamoyltransferase complex dimerization subunit type 1 TsaB [Planctomycetaceae bacterium]|jgi:tRNA threonylcarbamoyladenosine biosynthesis protein TsaB|nr:tRNA (adenosine(37)-N6)-threonylcarbamoyltransferase complex dimerization subunit type 1 TsaB [Planctomycetaceae bacterium]